MSVVVVTGTGTGVGKTVATAALASHARSLCGDVAVCKPVQTGTGTGDDDLAEVSRLCGVRELFGVASYPEPLAPAAAAELAGLALPALAELAAAVRAADRPGRLTLVEGAGGLLVEIAADRATLRDLARDLGAPVVVVCQAGLGTLNHTALTVEALERQQVPCAGLIIGSWPQAPGAAECYNRLELGRFGPVRAALPAGAARLAPPDFADMSRQAFDPGWIAGLV